MTFSLENAILWIEDLYFSRKQPFKNKNDLMMELFITNQQLFASQGVNWWTESSWLLVDYYDVLSAFYQLSFWRHPFTAEDSMVSKWYNTKFLHICRRNKLIYILNPWTWVHFPQTFIFGWTISLTTFLNLSLYNIQYVLLLFLTAF